MTKQRFHAAYTPPAARRDDINYPGAGVFSGEDAPPKASMVTYLGPEVSRFVSEFTERLGGWVDVPWAWHIQRFMWQRNRESSDE